MSLLRSQLRHDEFPTEHSASRLKVLGGDRYWLLLAGDHLDGFVIKPDMNLREVVQYYRIHPGIAGEFKDAWHDYGVPARAVARPAVMRVADDADGSMPIAVHIAIVLKKPPGRRNTFCQITEWNAVERIIEAGSKKI